LINDSLKWFDGSPAMMLMEVTEKKME